MKRERRRAIAVNVRFPLLLAAVCAAASLGISFAFGGGAAGAICGFLAAAVLVGVAVALCRTAFGRLVFCAAAVAVCAVPAVVTWARTARLAAAADVSGSVEVRCTIDGIPTQTGDVCEFAADEIFVDGKKLPFAATVVLETSEQYWNAVPVGTVVSLRAAAVKKLDAAEDGRLDADTLARPFEIAAREENVALTGTRGGNFIDRVRYRMIAALRQGLPAHEAGIACAMLLGDKRLLGSGQYENFKLAGIAHALAVSGLHVGFLLAALALIPLRGGRVVRAIRFAVTAAVLGLYAAMCGFAAGVVRAVVMGLAARFAALVGRRSDSWNDLGLAAIVLLLADAPRVAELGFRMSFLAAAGILAFAPLCLRLLRKLRCPARIASVVSASVGASVALLPVLATTFHTGSPWTLLENVVASPLIALTFFALVVCTLLALIPPFVPVLAVARLPLRVLAWFTAFCAKLPASDLVLFSFDALSAVVFAVAVFFLAEQTLYRSKRLAAAFRTGAALLLAALVLCVNLPTRAKTPKACIAGQYMSFAAIATEQGTLAVGSGDPFALSRLGDALVGARIRKLDVLVLTRPGSVDLDRLRSFLARFKVGAVYVDYGDESYAVVAGLGRAFTLVDMTVREGAFVLSSPLADRNVTVRVGGKTFLYAEKRPGFVEPGTVVFSAAPMGGLWNVRNIVYDTDDPFADTVISRGRFVPV